MPPTRPRYETLDAWRGLACLLVVLFHCPPDPAAATDASPAGLALAAVQLFWVGVPLFFVISGYCVAAAADSAARCPHPGRSFFLRRLRRIYPPLWAFLALAVLAQVVLGWVGEGTGLPLALSHRPPAEVSPAAWAGSLTLTEEWRANVVGPPRDYFQWHLWTLCYEEQFYLVVGLAVAVAPRRLFVVVGGVSVLVFLVVIDVLRPPVPTGGFFFDGSWLEFAAGVAVYYRHARASRFAARLIDVGLLAALAWAARGVPDWGNLTQSVPAHLTVAFALAFALGVAQRWDAATAGWRVLRPLRWCGVRCYSLYLVHSPVAYLCGRLFEHFGWTSPTAVVVAALPVGVAASLACGWAFHRWVEARFFNPPAPG